MIVWQCHLNHLFLLTLKISLKKEKKNACLLWKEMKAKCCVDAMNCYDDVSHIEEKEVKGTVTGRSWGQNVFWYNRIEK